MNKSLFLTRGNPVGIVSLLERLNPSTESYTAVLTPLEGSRSCYSQVVHQPGNRSARFTFLLPAFNKEEEGYIPAMLDFLSFQAGEMGALNLLAEIEESHPLFEMLRRAGFSVFSWESVWKIMGGRLDISSTQGWHTPNPAEENAIRNLYQTLVPPLVQNAEPFINGSTPRLVYRVGDETLAYVESLSGPRGIYLVPIIHPSVDNIHNLLSELLNQFLGAGKPVYLQVRSYQAWLSEALTNLQVEPSPRFALLVKHLALAQYSPSRQPQVLRAEQRRVEPTAPIMRALNDAHPNPENTD